jgi:hypothetical protein
MTEHEIKIKFTEYTSIDELSTRDRALCLEAVKALKTSHSPYSKFRVGVAMQLQSGKILHASNQENAAYPSGLCAERVALFHWGANHADDPIQSMAITALINACVYTSTRNNSDEDKAAAEKVVSKLFDLLKAKNYDATYSLFSDSLWVNTKKEKLKDLYTYTDNKLGDIQSDSLAKWQTRVTSGTTYSARYEFIYYNHYQKGTAEVSILLAGEKGKIKILGYHVNSDQFLAK